MDAHDIVARWPLFSNKKTEEHAVDRWTKENLDEARARALAYERYGDAESWPSFKSAANAIRASDEFIGISTEALLAILNGELALGLKRRSEMSKPEYGECRDCAAWDDNMSRPISYTGTKRGSFFCNRHPSINGERPVTRETNGCFDFVPKDQPKE